MLRLADRLGRRPVILAWIALHVLAGSASHHPARQASGFMTLGFGC
jgi:hypothetical protein